MPGFAAAPATWGDVAGTWALDPIVLALLVATALVYGRAVSRWWRELGRGAAVSPGQVVAFSGGLLALIAALVSPLEPLAESLFAAHMVQHLLLTLVAAPLLLLGRAHVALVPVLPVGLRRRWGRRLARGLRRVRPTTLAVAVALHVITVLAWHAPVLYDLAVAITWVHVTEHVTLLGTALVFWAAMGATRPRPVAAAALAAFVSSLLFVLLAAAMTAASTPWYASHLSTTGGFGLDPLQDQQVAAAIMWVPGGLVYLGAAAASVVRWIRNDERDLALERPLTR